MAMKRTLAAALLVSIAVAPGALADPPDCNCPRVKALAANPQLTQNQFGDRFNLAILANGAVRCWGTNCPPRVGGPPQDAVAVAAGYNHYLVLHTNGTVEQIRGVGSNMPPVPADAQTGVIAVEAGVVHSVALRADGRVVAWGEPSPPSLGGLPNPNATIPADAQTDVTAIAAGYYHTLALRDDGTVVQWGSSGSAPTSALHDIVAIGAGWGPSLAVTKDGEAIEWDSSGNLSSVPALAQSDVVQVAAGAEHRLALRSDGTVVAWGNMLDPTCPIDAKSCNLVPAYGYPGFSTIEFDRPDLYKDPSPRPEPVCSLVPTKPGKVRIIAAGGFRSLGLLNDGTVVGWGDPIGYPIGIPPLNLGEAPPVPEDLVGPHCVAGLTGIRLSSATVPAIPMGSTVSLDVAIDRIYGSRVPARVTLLDAAANGVEASFKFPTGSASGTSESKGVLNLHVIDWTQNLPPGHYVWPPPVERRSLRLQAVSGGIAVESSFEIDVHPPVRLQLNP